MQLPQKLHQCFHTLLIPNKQNAMHANLFELRFIGFRGYLFKDSVKGFALEIRRLVVGHKMTFQQVVFQQYFFETQCHGYFACANGAKQVFQNPVWNCTNMYPFGTVVTLPANPVCNNNYHYLFKRL